MSRAFDLPGIDTDERFIGGKARRDNAAAITTMFDAAFAKFTKAEIAERMTREEIAWAPAQTLAEVAVDPQVMAAGGIVNMPTRVPGETITSPGGPARFVGLDDGPKGPGPALGEHTREVLKSVGYSESQIDAALESKTVA
jgi:crotonobetainyl-CoA:carnitine CoA-transferase CaiB-like acyl-CoA transferase